MNDPFSRPDGNEDTAFGKNSGDALADILDPELMALLQEEPEQQLEAVWPRREEKATKEKPKKEKSEKPKKEKDEMRSGRKTGWIAAAVIGGLILTAAAAAGLFQLNGGTALLGGKLPEGARVGSVDVGGMSRSAAIRTVKETLGQPLEHTDMVVQLPDTTLVFTPAETGVRLDAAAAVAASAAGEVDPGDFITVNEAAIREQLDAYASGFAGSYTPSGYALEGQMPPLEDGNYSESNPTQTLVLTVGTPGLSVDMDSVYEQMRDGFASGNFLVTVNETETTREPAPIDPDAVYAEICVEPVEPRMDKETLQPIPGSWGYGFDLESVRNQLANASYGDVIRVPMEYIPTKIQGDDVYFLDMLGCCMTPHSDNEKRNANLALACSMLNGVVIQPGQTISYNELVGERTAERGFLPAPAYSGTRLIDSIGGGVCQVSSTLYLCSCFAEFETVERVNHGYPVRYIPIGLDATVNWGTTDLKITNPYPLPVKIQAEVSDGFVKIRMMGTELRDYYVKMEYRAGGRFSSAYVCRYDLQTDEQIYREFHHRSAYLEDVQSQYGWRDCDVWEPEEVPEENTPEATEKT